MLQRHLSRGKKEIVLAKLLRLGLSNTDCSLPLPFSDRVKSTQLLLPCLSFMFPNSGAFSRCEELVEQKVFHLERNKSPVHSSFCRGAGGGTAGHGRARHGTPPLTRSVTPGKSVKLPESWPPSSSVEWGQFLPFRTV